MTKVFLHIPRWKPTGVILSPLAYDAWLATMTFPSDTGQSFYGGRRRAHGDEPNIDEVFHKKTHGHLV